MKLSKFYSNKAALFEPVYFRHGLNVVLAEIRLPENLEKDSHNLGKTKLALLLDYGFLVGRDATAFLFKHFDVFKDFVFFLEIELGDGSFVTVRRGVEDATKISFKKHKVGHQDFSTLPLPQWDHQQLPFERARDLLDGLLSWQGLNPWTFRKVIGYLLRSQDDYQEVFKLRKFASKHADWKPFLAHLLGFDAQLIDEHYKKEEELSNKKEIANTIKNELSGGIDDLGKIDGILLLKTKDAEKTQKLLDAFDFRKQDKDQTKQLVNDIDERIAEHNSRRYSLSQNKKKIQASLVEDQILFDPEEAERLFKEAGILFKGQIKKDFQQLIDFNRAITDERRGYLEEESVEIDAELKQVNAELNTLGKKRSKALSYLSGTDIFDKYKTVSDEMVVLRADIESLERQRHSLHRLQDLRLQIRKLKEECGQLQDKIEDDIEKQSSDSESLFSNTRIFFNEIVEEVISRKALLGVSQNKEGHLDFRVDILDETGKATSADDGHTYKKLLCIAFDMAVLRAHKDDKFPRFIYHDGVFENLDNRKKQNLLAVIRRHTAHGLQHVITLIDSDMPENADSEPAFSPDEIVVTLHDEDEQGLLFKMPTW